ncbi:hypothetical protein PM082_009806 [Marasmius tenuissimus]|nr:hypothetical protein PM082_009806 [Marasmius tenuissimus]
MTGELNLEWGGEVGEKMSSKMFLKKAEIAFGQMMKKPDEFVEGVELFFKEGSRAEKWHSELTEAQKEAGWRTYKSLLMAEFPAREIVTRKPADFIKELLEMQLSIDGLEVKDKETNQWPHQKFADTVYGLAKAGSIADTAAYIVSVHKNLPRFLQVHVDEEASDWAAFRDALKKVDIKVIREKLETARDIQTLRAHQVALQAPNTPRTKLANSFGNIQIHQGPAQPRQGNQASAATTADPFRTNTGGRGNIQYQGAQQRQTQARVSRLTPAQKETLRENVNRYEQRPDTPQGHILWRQDVANFVNQWGRDILNERVVYPITPGTWKPGSGECWGCGARCGGGKGNCASAKRIPIEERRYRSMVQAELGAFQQKPVAQANVVGAEDGLEWMFAGYSSGNAEGSTE